MLKIYGASDDLIELEGDLNEEIGAYDSGPAKERRILLSCGIVATIKYDGVWIVRMVANPNGVPTEFHSNMGMDSDRYTDTLVINADVHWAHISGRLLWREKPKPVRRVRGKE